MQSSVLSVVLLPLGLAIIMMGLGLSLTLADFKRIITYPKAIIIGLFCQMILLPFICYFIAVGFKLSPELAVGLMLLAAAPGGPTSNLFSHVAKGDVALNVSLTAINSLLSVFTISLIVNISIATFMATGDVIPLQFKKIMEVCLIVLGPVSIGMLIRSKAPKIAEKLNKPVKIASAVFLAIIIILTLYSEKENLPHYFSLVGIPALLFNVLCMAIGYYVPRLFSLDKSQPIANGMEIGIHNGTLAIFIALSVIGNNIMATPAAIYSLFMFFTAAIFGVLVNKF
jgi:BASS family bile acid:Na+ symporter